MTSRRLEQFAHETATCTFCPKMCRFSCPVDRVEHDEAVTPTAKQTALYLLERGDLEWTPDVASVFYKCTGCRIQQTFCTHKIDVTPVFRAAREEAVRRGVAPEAVTHLRERFRAGGNLHESDERRVADAVGEVGAMVAAVGASAAEAGVDARRGWSNDLFFAGCTSIMRRPGPVRDFYRLMAAVGEPLPKLYSGPAICCGMPLSDAGLETDFRVHAARVHAALDGARRAGGRVIVADPDCASTLLTRYRDVGYDLSDAVVPSVRVLWERRDKLKRRLTPRAGDVVYHDSCYLGRVFGMYDEPRELLKLAVSGRVAEPFHTRAAATCSGAGGVFPVTSPESARGMAALAAGELREADPSATIVGSCASSAFWMEESNAGFAMKDLVTVLADALAP